ERSDADACDPTSKLELELGTLNFEPFFLFGRDGESPRPNRGRAIRRRAERRGAAFRRFPADGDERVFPADRDRRVRARRRIGAAGLELARLAVDRIEEGSGG